MKDYKDYPNYRYMPVSVPGISQNTADNLEIRIAEFEEKHLTNSISGGDGWVPKIKARDILFAAVVNGIILVYYIWALLS